MFDVELFLGIASSQLKTRDDRAAKQFFNGSPEYLQESDFKEQSYVGKRVETPCTKEQLELLQNHVASLIHQVFPETSNTKLDFYLFPVEPAACPIKK